MENEYKRYEAPVFEFVVFSVQDVVRASERDVADGDGGFGENVKGEGF
ncbi:MAG: hypothetical protein HUK22_06370 [Thermoguttaceae bacterium]|nr:hypothetical protein [Thermoguttaceae bacterium]